MRLRTICHRNRVHFVDADWRDPLELNGQDWAARRLHSGPRSTKVNTIQQKSMKVDES
jgi:hypothetical protein